MSTLKPYTHRDHRDAVLPRDVLDAIGAESWVMQGELIVFAPTAASAAAHLCELGILTNPNVRQLRIATGNDVDAIAAHDHPALTVLALAYSSRGGVRDVIAIQPTAGAAVRELSIAGHLSNRRYTPAGQTTEPVVTDAMVEAALDAINVPRDVPAGWLVRDMKAAITAALKAQEAKS